jgi:AraC-like DNA-binding protein
MATIGIPLVRAVVDEVERRGLDSASVLAAAGIERAVLEDPFARIESAAYDRLQRRALDVTADPAFGLHMGEHASLAAFSLVGQLAVQCRTVRDGLAVLLRYYRIVADAPPPRLVEHGDQALLVYEIVRSPDPLCNRLRVEFGLTCLCSFAESFVGAKRSEREVEVWFEHDAPEHASEYARIFRNRERFRRPSTGLLFPRAQLDTTQRHYDDRLFRLIRNEAEERLEELDGGVVGQVRRTIVSAYPDVALDVAGLAERLGMSSRSLRRHLRREGRTFPEVIREAMREIACRLLMERNATIQEAAYRMGFSEASAFHRAFKRWTGLTPAQWRRSASGGCREDR